MYVIIEDEIVACLNVHPTIYGNAIEASNDIICGDKYINGEFLRIAERPIIIETPKEPMTEERIALLEDTINYLLGL